MREPLQTMRDAQLTGTTAKAIPSLRTWLAIAVLACLVGGGILYYGYSHRPAGRTLPATAPLRDTVNVLGVWGGSELESFLAMVRPFEQKNRVKVEFEGTRDINAVLTTRVIGGNPPDIAGLPTPGQLADFARRGKLVPLDGVLDLQAMRREYAQSWLEMATVDGRVYGVFVKAALKGLIWYAPKAFQRGGYTVPKTWEQLLALTDRVARDGKTPWCIGLESGAASGWPATDWIESIMLRTAGPEVYQQWYQHKIAWTDPKVKRAWGLFGKIAADPRYVRGGIQGELATNFGESPFPMFKDPPGCYLHHQAAFIQDFIQKQYPNLIPVVDIDFFPFPRIDPSVPAAVEVGGDVFAMFRDTPQARAFIRYLTSPDAQAIWVKRGGAFSANRRVALSGYPDPLSRRAAEMLTRAEIARFDASDMMPVVVNSAFLRATLDFVQRPGALDQILDDLDRVATNASKR